LSEDTPERAKRVWELMQRFVLLGSVCGVAAGGVTATVQHSDDVVDVLSFIRWKVDPDAPAAAPAAANPLPAVAAPAQSAFGPLPVLRVRAVDVTSLEDGGGMLRGAVDWDFEIRDAVTGVSLELESRAYRGDGTAQAFGAERPFTQAVDEQVTLLIDGWFHDRLGRRELRIRELVHVDFSAPPAPVRVRALQGADWGTFDIRLERVKPARAKQPS
jgi:hypothetical protein